MNERSEELGIGSDLLGNKLTLDLFKMAKTVETDTDA